MDNIQAMINGMSDELQRERAETQMTLGGMIEILESALEGALIDGIEAPHSYRGYYIDLAFEPKPGKISASDALQMCRSAMGQVFCGYKGGDYVMGALTPLWIAHYGCCGKKIIAFDEAGSFLLAEDNY